MESGLESGRISPLPVLSLWARPAGLLIKWVVMKPGCTLMHATANRLPNSLYKATEKEEV